MNRYFRLSHALILTLALCFASCHGLPKSEDPVPVRDTPWSNGESRPAPATTTAAPGPQGSATREASPATAPVSTTTAALASPTNTAPAPASPPGALTLEEAIRRAMEKSPDLAVARRAEGVKTAALEVARTYPYNPTVDLDVRPFTRESTGEDGEVFVGVAVLQEIELTRKGRHREKDGLAELSRTQSTIERETTLVVAEVERRFFTALYWRDVLVLAEALAALNTELVQVLERRFNAALTPSSALAMGRIEAQAQRQQVELLRVRQNAALVELRRVLAIPETEPMEPLGDFENWKWPEVSRLLGPSFAGVVEKNVAGGKPTTGQGASAPLLPSPPATGAGVTEGPRRDPGTGAVLTDELAEERSDVRAASYASDAARARLDLAAAERIPNITVGPVYEKDESGTNFLGVQLQVPLPVFSTGGPKERERQAELEQSLEELRQLRLKAKMEIESAVTRYGKALRLRDSFRDELFADFEKNLERVVHQFEAGRASIVDVFTARGKLIQARQNYLESVYELSLSAADLTVATPLPVASLLPRVPSEEDQNQ